MNDQALANFTTKIVKDLRIGQFDMHFSRRKGKWRFHIKQDDGKDLNFFSLSSLLEYLNKNERSREDK